MSLEPQYYDLIIRDPVCLSKGSESPSPARQWFHAKSGCNGKMQIGDDAQLKCVACDESFHIRNARYDSDSYTIDFCLESLYLPSIDVQTAGQITGVAGMQWLIRLLENMGDD